MRVLFLFGNIEAEHNKRLLLLKNAIIRPRHKVVLRMRSDLFIYNYGTGVGYVFTARCSASAVLATALCPSVCLSVRHKSGLVV